MKLCYIYGATFRGPKNIIEEMEKRGHDIFHILSSLPRDEEQLPNKYFYINTKSSKIRIIKELIKVKKIIKKFNPDILHLFNVGPKTCWANYLVSPHMKLVGSTGGTDIREHSKLFLPYKLCQRRFLRRVDLLTLNGTDLREKLIHLGVDESKLKIVYFGVPVNNELLKQINKKRDTKRDNEVNIVFSALFFKPSRGPDLLIKSILKFNEQYVDLAKRTKFFIAGTGPLINKTIQIFKEKSKIDNCVFLGYIPHNEVFKWLEKADAFLLTSTTCSGVGIALLEAMLYQVPVITTNVGAYNDFVINGKTGFISDKNPEEIATNIYRCLTDKEKSFQLAKKGQNIVIQKGNSITNAQIMEKLYERLILK